MRAALTAWLGLTLPRAGRGPGGARARASGSAPRRAAALKALWEESVAAHQERVACLAADIRGDTVFVSRSTG